MTVTHKVRVGHGLARRIRGVLAACLAAGAAACISTDNPWPAVATGPIPAVEGPLMPAAFRVPQIAFGDQCPRDLSFYRLQLQNPSRLPGGLSMTTEDAIVQHGSMVAAQDALRAEILTLRTGLSQIAAVRPLDDRTRRETVDRRLDDLADRLLYAQALLAALECEQRKGKKANA